MPPVYYDPWSGTIGFAITVTPGQQVQPQPQQSSLLGVTVPIPGNPLGTTTPLAGLFGTGAAGSLSGVPSPPIQVGPVPVQAPPPAPVPAAPAGLPGLSCDQPLFVQICQPQQQPPSESQTPPQGTLQQEIVIGPGVAIPLGVGPSTCDQIDQWANQFVGLGPADILTAAGITSESGQFAWLSTIIDQVGEWPVVGDGLAIILSALGAVLVAPITAWISVQNYIASVACKNSGAIAQISNMRGPLVWMRRLLGMETKQIERIFDQWENYICPVNIPSVFEADIARRTGEITPEEWRCWVRLNGFDETVHQRIYNANRVQLTPHEIISLWRRQELNDQEVTQWLYRAGMISTNDQIALATVTEFIPPVTDLIRFTARALGDRDLVQKFRLEEGFDDLYKDQLREWGIANGISDDVMRYYFAGTRQIPAPGQLFTMLQRLRADNVPPGTDPNNWTTTTADLDRALREQHYSPFWWSRFEAISYVPIGIRQLRKPYTDGALQAEDLLPRLQDLGYSRDNALVYLNALKIERRDVLRKNPITKLYENAAINRVNAGQRLVSEGYTDQEVSDALDWAEQEFLDKSRLKCVEGLKKRYECGEFDQGEIEQELSGLDLDPNQITTLRVRWDCEKKQCGKQVSASQLCSWADSGLIDYQEHYRRLTNVGYSDIDARNIVAECNIKQETKVLAQRERAARQLLQQLQQAANRQNAADRRAIAETRRAANDLRRIQREIATAEARAARQADAAQSRADHIRSALLRTQSSQAGKIRTKEVMLAKAAEVWSAVSGQPLLDAGNVVNQAVEAVHTTIGTSADIALRAVVLAALDAKKAKTIDLIAAALDTGRLLQEYASVATAAVCEQTNGTCQPVESSAGISVQVDTSIPSESLNIPSSTGK